uniref:Fumarylacetoacetase-like C-terminal domain-containing protein n=2 Tax=Clastoptera arizonana TaxID=38151 RepID=A0A1B6CY00_9HEMI
MRFVQYKCLSGGPQKLGVQLAQDGNIIEVSAVDPMIPNNLVQFLDGGTNLIEKVKRIVAEEKSICHLENVELLAPVTKPDKIICVGLNYKAHCDDLNLPYPVEPCIFNKFPSTIIGPNSAIIHPTNTKTLDWEVEMGVVIGKKARNVSKKDAFDYVFGYTIAQDISARDWFGSRNNGQWLIGKSMDTFCPLGPTVVMKEYFGLTTDKVISCSINGKLKQSAVTSDLIYGVDSLISYISQCFTFLPGDIILTGTPSEVGMHQKPPEYLNVGDVIVSEISGIGQLKNIVV